MHRSRGSPSPDGMFSSHDIGDRGRSASTYTLEESLSALWISPHYMAPHQTVTQLRYQTANGTTTNMSFRKSLGQTINSFTRSFAPWGILASLVSVFLAYQIVGWMSPDASGAMIALWTIVGAIAIYLVGFVALAIAVTIVRKPNANSE